MAIERQFSGTRPARPAPWRDPRVRSIVYQALTLIVVVLLVAYFVDNTLTNLSRQGIAAGFGFLDRTAGFDIGFTLIDYSAVSTYGRAFWVGLLNTLLVSALGVVLATILGFVIGLARLSTNWLVARLAIVYIETIRNIPLLLQLLFWYFAVLQALPHPRESVAVADTVFLNNRGLSIPLAVLGRGRRGDPGRAAWSRWWRSSCWGAGPGAGARRPGSRSPPCWYRSGCCSGCRSWPSSRWARR